MKYLSLHVLLSIAFIGQVSAMNKVPAGTQQPTAEYSANDMNNNNGTNDDTDDDNGADYTVEAELMGAYGMQGNGVNGYVMQLEDEEEPGMYGMMQKATGAYGAASTSVLPDFEQDLEEDFTLDSNGSYGMLEASETLTGTYGRTQDTTKADDTLIEPQEDIADTEQEPLK